MFVVHCLCPEPLRAATPGVVLAAATVDGHAGVFLLDTGTTRSCPDTRFAVRLGLEVEGRANLTRNYAEGTADNSQGIAVWETANTKSLVTMDREDIETAWVKTRTALEAK